MRQRCLATWLAVAMSVAPMAWADSPPPVKAVSNDNLNAVLWSQSVDHDLVYRQTYAIAQRELSHALGDRHWDALPHGERKRSAVGLKPAVVFDIDETLIDNSAHMAQLLEAGEEDTDAKWDAWARRKEALAMPGAVEFARFAVAHGVALIIITNDTMDLRDTMLAQLRQIGFPAISPDAYLGLDMKVPGCQQANINNKTCRRGLISQKYRVLMQFGDQLGDFVDLGPNTPQTRKQAVTPYFSWFGERWFLLPNPSYGYWESAVEGPDSQSTDEKRQKAWDALRLP